MLPARQTRGFVLLRKPDKLVAEYNASEIAQKNLVFLEQMREAVSFLEPRDYRGISRELLLPWSSIDEELLKSGARTLVDLKREQKARRKFLQINGEDREEWDYYEDGWDYNKGLLTNLDSARDILGFLSNPSEYEILEVCREDYGTEFDTVGFDIGYWGGDGFSLICDSVIMPRWHPPVPEGLADLGDRLACLNQYVLFSNVKEAALFREYYMSRVWGEKELYPGQFCIIQLALPEI